MGNIKTINLYVLDGNSQLSIDESSNVSYINNDFNKILAVNLIGISVFSMWVSLDKSVPDLYASSHRLYISAVKINNALKDLQKCKYTG